ncbi:hypothetical protein Afil01_64790 [Actinorhabdospora filicis]|uniref:TNF family profile domain-containing protein n=1 Tax=Actinorhabdospora filicis TaxID=1785913 RepID=A0A9W6SST6_9ACTN|nr:hypothetical protein [Actinorhabdospora filicis]GLZ81672.1 hypothetical protein Afil01_64790 [Actinorhabdospora filicis]
MGRFTFPRRPWPTSVVVLLTAIIAAGAGYALAASRPAPHAPKDAPMALQSWVAETALPDPLGSAKAPAKALAEPPDGAQVVHSMAMASLSEFGTGGIQALPAGRYLVYAGCKAVNAPADFKNVSVNLNIAYSGRTDYTSVPCPSKATAPVLRVNAPQDVVVHAGFEVNVPDPERAGDTIWSTDVGVALFFVLE